LYEIFSLSLSLISRVIFNCHLLELKWVWIAHFWHILKDAASDEVVQISISFLHPNVT
jgi:hypothetical protein